MRKDQNRDLMKFLKPFSPEITGLVFWLRDFTWDLYPDTNELIYDNYNAVATDRLGHVFCSIGIFRSNQNIYYGFYRGSEIADPEKNCWAKENNIVITW